MKTNTLYNWKYEEDQCRRTGSIGQHIARQQKAMEYGTNKSKTLAGMAR